jgi:hypothetical protein
MSMNTVFNLSGNDNRMFAIDAIAGPHQAMQRSIAYTLKVPYSGLAKTLHSIGQRGGKVVNVRLLSVLMSTEMAIPEASTPIAAQILPVPDVAIPVVTQESVVVEEKKAPSPQSKQTVDRTKSNSRRQSSKSKRR